MKKKQRIKHINSLFEIPQEVVSNEPKVTILGFYEVLIENHKNIVEYEENFIKINTYTGCVSFWGINLRLRQMGKDDIIIEGNIEKIEYESSND